MEFQINFRKFTEADIPSKVRWINDSGVNRFLHYDIPINEAKTLEWYHKKKDDPTRADYVIEVIDAGKAILIGLIGLLNIDHKNRKAEFYMTIGEKDYSGKGIGTAAATNFFDFSFREYNLNKIYCYIEVDNIAANKQGEKSGFKREGLLREDLIHRGRIVDRYFYGVLREEFYNEVSSGLLHLQRD